MNSRRQDQHVRIFGGPVLFRAGEEVALTPQQACVLAMLYGGDEPAVLKTQVCEVLWPHEDSVRSRKNLNQLLYSLRRRVGEPGLFDTDGLEIRRPRAGISCDMDAFRDDLKDGRLDACAAYLRKGFASKTTGRVTRDLTDWASKRAAELRRSLRRKAELQWRTSAQGEDWEGARIAAGVLLQLRPGDETQLRRFMEASTKAGKVAEATAAYGEFFEKGDDFARLPSPGIRDLMGRVERVLALREKTYGKARGRSPIPPLQGREEERAQLQNTLSAAQTRELRAVLVTGEAGIGKTRLITEALHRPSLEGHSILSADSAELEQRIPLNPLIELFKDSAIGERLRHLDEPWRSVLYGVMPSHFPGDGPIPEAPHIQPGSVPRRLFEAFYQLLISLVQREPIILIIEDLQWADETTVSVLDFLLRRWDHGRLQLIVSVRTEEIRKHPTVAKFLENLRSHPGSLVVHLEDLAENAVEALINSLAEEPLEHDDVARLRSLGGGNPFFLIELTLELLAGRLGPVVTPAGIVPIPLSIRQVLERRLSRLSTEADRVLGALAVFSRPMHITDLASVADLTNSECLAGLDQLHEFRLMTHRGSGVAISHELVRQTVYQNLTDSRRAWLHERVARHLLANRHPASPDELAVHFHHGGVRDEARDYSIEAANRAQVAGAIPEALDFLRIAREHAENADTVANLLGRMGHLNYLRQNLEEAAPLLELAAQRFRRLGNVAEALEREVERIDCLAKLGENLLRDCLDELEVLKVEALEHGHWEVFFDALDVEAHQLHRAGDLDGVRAVLREAQDNMERGTPKARCKAKTVLASNTYFGPAADGLSAARDSVRLALTTSDNELILRALNMLIVALHYQGQLHSEEGRRALSEAESRVSTCGDLILKFFVKQNPAVWLLEIGELDFARSALEPLGNLVNGTKALEAQIMLSLNLGELGLVSNELESARSSFLDAERLITPVVSHFFQTIATAGLGLCSLHSGDLSDARQREEELPEAPAFWTFDPTVVTTFRARMLLKRRDLDQAIQVLDQTREDIKERFIPAWLRLTLEEAKICRRDYPEKSVSVAVQGLEVARGLKLVRRTKQLEDLLKSLSRGVG